MLHQIGTSLTFKHVSVLTNVETKKQSHVWGHVIAMHNNMKQNKFTPQLEKFDELPSLFCILRNNKNTPGTRGWSRIRDRTLAVAKNRAKMTFFSGGKKNYLKKNIFFAYIFQLCQNIGGNKFSRTGDSPKWVKSRRRRRKEKKKESR